MTTDMIISIIASILTSAITAFAVVAFKMGRYSEKIDQLEKCDLQRRVSTLEGSLTPASITQRKSPVTLNDRGIKLLNDSNAKKFVDDNLNELMQKIRDFNVSTAYDVQEKSKQVIESYRNDNKFAPLKDYAFKQGVELELIELAASFYLRDQALPKFSFTQEDVDKTEPHK